MNAAPERTARTVPEGGNGGIARHVVVMATGVIVLILAACNPFAPALDETAGTQNSILGDQTTVDGLFQNIQFAYTFRDTTIYGQLLDPQYLFIYRDYDRGADVSWGRDEELRTTYGLFQNAQRLDLVWNNLVSESTDTTGMLKSVSRNFSLSVTFNPSDIIRVEGYVNLTLKRYASDNKWYIVSWRDESNF